MNNHDLLDMHQVKCDKRIGVIISATFKTPENDTMVNYRNRKKHEFSRFETPLLYFNAFQFNFKPKQN